MITGDDTGLCKHVSLTDGRVLVRWGEQMPGNGVRRLCVRGSLIACGREGGSVDVYQLHADTSVAPSRVSTLAREDRDAVAGLAFAGEERLVVADAAGRIEVYKSGFAGDGGASELIASTDVKAHTAQLRVDPGGMLAASGGRDHELRVWDLSTLEVRWRAHNVAEDSVRLAVPVWHCDLAFSGAEPHLLAACSGLVEQRLRAEVRLYDVRAVRKPVLRAIAPMGDVALCSLALGREGRYAYAGNATGDLGQLDARKGFALVGLLKGAGGAVTGVQVSPHGRAVCSVSLDRFARSHSSVSREAQLQSYLRQKLTALALLPLEAAGGQTGQDEEAEPDAESDDEAAEARAERRAVSAAAREADASAVAAILDGLAPARDGGEREGAADEAAVGKRKRAKAAATLEAPSPKAEPPKPRAGAKPGVGPEHQAEAGGGSARPRSSARAAKPAAHPEAAHRSAKPVAASSSGRSVGRK